MRAAVVGVHLAAVSLLVVPNVSGQLVPDAAGQPAGPSLVLSDTLVLQEDGDHYVSAPLGVGWSPDGSLLVADGYANAILPFDGSGRFVRAFGGPGQGPGEFVGIGPIMLAGDLIGGIDMAAMNLEVFDYRSGAHVGAIALRPSVRITSMTDVGDSVWIAGMERSVWMSVGTVAIDELPALTESGSQHALRLDRVTVPPPYRTNPRMFGSMGNVFLDKGDSDMVLGFSGTGYLLHLRSDEQIDTLHLVPRLRRGAPAEDDVAEMDPGVDPVTFFNSLSGLAALSRDEDGNIIVIHTERQVERASREMGMRVVSQTIYVSGLSPDGTRQCADTEVPIAIAGRPRAVLRGRMLYLIDQIPADRGDVRTVVREYEVDPLACYRRNT